MLFVYVMLCFYHVTLPLMSTCLRASIKSNSVQGSHRRLVVNLAASKNTKSVSHSSDGNGTGRKLTLFSLTHNRKYLPDNSWVELSVNEDHHLKGHGDPQPSNARHRRLNPEHTCECRTLRIRMKSKYFLLVPNLI